MPIHQSVYLDKEIQIMMAAREIMTKDVVSISGSATVAEAVTLMKEKGLRSLIVDRRNEEDPYGMVTETDIVYKVAAHGHDPKKMRVYQIMTKPCIVVTPELGVEYVARLFANAKIRRAPVVQGRLLGVISISDILRKSDFVEKPKTDFYGYGSYMDDPEVLQEREYDV